jgi:hypothetical protein
VIDYLPSKCEALSAVPPKKSAKNFKGILKIKEKELTILIL